VVALVTSPGHVFVDDAMIIIMINKRAKTRRQSEGESESGSIGPRRQNIHLLILTPIPSCSVASV